MYKIKYKQNKKQLNLKIIKFKKYKKKYNKTSKKYKRLDVGWEGKVYSFEEIKEYMEPRKNKIV